MRVGPMTAKYGARLVFVSLRHVLPESAMDNRHEETTRVLLADAKGVLGRGEEAELGRRAVLDEAGADGTSEARQQALGLAQILQR